MRDLSNEQMFEGMYSVSPILSEILFRQQREGQESSFQDEQGKVRQIDFQHRSVTFERKTEEAKGMSVPEFIDAARRPGIEMGKLMLKDLFQQLHQVTEEVGNVVNAGGKPLTYEFLLAAWDKVQIDFDASGKPRMPSLVVDPKTHADLQQKLPEWLEDKTFQSRLEAILRRQWGEFCAREACRRLVD